MNILFNKKLFLITLVIFAVFGFSAKAEAATNVYYSVGQNTTDHKTGTPTLTISGGVGTFSVAQTATNMGVGDKVTFNTSSVCYISSKTSTSVWNLITATGAACSDVTDATVDSIAHAFSSLNAAVGGASPGAAGASYLNTANLVTGDYILNIPAYYDSGPDTTAITINGWTTGTNNYIFIYTPQNTSTEVNQTQRHSGVWSDTKYNLVFDTTGVAVGIAVQEDYVTFDGLQIQRSDSSAAAVAIQLAAPSLNQNQKISNSIFKKGVNTYFGEAIQVYEYYTKARIWNNIFIGQNMVSPRAAVRAVSGATQTYLYNNTFTNSTVCANAVDTFIAKNNLFYNCTNPAIGTFSAGTDYNATNNASIGYAVTGGGNTHDRTSQTFSFEDAVSNNFHLASGDSGVKDNGVNLSSDANIAFNTDIDGESRSSPWDIGADEYYVPDLTAPTVTAFVIPATASSTTVLITTFTATDNVAVTGYLINESSSAPNASDPNWSGTPHSSYTISSGYSSKTLYAWAKDSAGNVSITASASVIFDNTSPTISSFSIPSTSNSLTISITTFTATDTNGVTGYLATTTNTTPTINDSGWVGTSPISYTFSSGGSKTLYAWAKDEAGNISASSSASVTVNVYHYIRDGATGDGSGSDWTNALTSLPSTFVRGEVYYVASGNYGRLLIDTATGEGDITVKKATPSDHGTDTGWQSSYGTGTAVFTSSTNIPMYISVSDVVVDGSYRGSDWVSGYGFKFDNTKESGYTNGAEIADGVSNVTLLYLDIGTNPLNLDGETNGIRVNALTQDSISDLTFSYLYVHDSSQDILLFRRVDNLVVDHSYIARNRTNGVTHGQGISNDCSNNVVINNNIFRDIQSSGQICSGMNATCSSDNWKIYNNIFFESTDTATIPLWGGTNGAIRNWDSYGTRTGWHIYNNTFANLGDEDASLILDFPTGSTGNYVYNNLFYNESPLANILFLNHTHDYNWFYGVTNMPTEDNRILGTGDPFVGANLYDFRLADGVSAIDAGKSDLGSPYNTDFSGISRPQGLAWDIGAYEYVETTYTIAGTVSGLSGTVVLQNNSGDNESISSSGAFTFDTALSDGVSYAVTVLTQPSGQTCTVTNGSGTVSSANVTNVAVTCTTDSTPAPSSGGGGGGGSSSGSRNTVVTAIPQTTLSFVFNRNLSSGSEGTDVIELQKFLVSQGYTTSDNITGYFGPKTQLALQAFQKANNIVSSGTPGSTGYGNFGAMTRAKVNSMLASSAGLGQAGSSQVNVSASMSVAELQAILASLQKQIVSLLTQLMATYQQKLGR